MKNIYTTLAIGILVLFFISQVSASGYSGKTESGGEAGSMAEAIKHAEMAKTHKGDAKKLLHHAERSLKYAKKAEKETTGKGNARGVAHITASITHLEEAIQNAKAGHAEIAIEHVDDALEEMHQFVAK